MFGRKSNITICASKILASDIEVFVNGINTYGAIDVYIDGDKLYTTFVTRLNAHNVEKLIESKLYKAIAEVRGNVIFVK